MQLTAPDPTSTEPPHPAPEDAGELTGEEPGARLPTCVLLATRNGAGQLYSVVRRARRQCPVFVISDASTDATAEVARLGGAEVLELDVNVGKPAAIRAGLEHFAICARFETVIVIDDDTTLQPDFAARCLARMRGGVGIVVGKTTSDWRHGLRWNPWVASRAFAYWRYQLFVRRGQSTFNVMNCISGSNSMYRSDLLAELTREPTPYIVDDTYWTLETHRRKLGRIVYAPDASAAVQDPADLSSWYRQNLRWLWGTMQGIHGHKVGRRRSWFDIAYVGIILDWFLYVALWPLLLVASVAVAGTDVVQSLALYVAGYLGWSLVGAIALRRWRLVALFPMLMAIDWIYRVIYVHALIKTIRQPRVESCVWESPQRYLAA